MREFVARQNIAHYRDQIRDEADPDKRAGLVKLLAEEEAELERATHVKDVLKWPKEVS